MSESKPTPGEMANSFYEMRGHVQFGGGKKRILHYWKEDFYFWDKGVYRLIPPDEMKAILVLHLNEIGIVATTTVVENMRLNLSALTILSGERVPNTWLTTKEGKEPVEAIVMENGILTFRGDGTVEIGELSPDFFTMNKLPYKYDPEATCERWERFIEEVTLGNQEIQRLLQQWAGYLLTTNQKYQAFMLLLGDAATGKGTYTRAMRGMLGENNCSDLPLRRFTNNFSLYMTYGKKLNVAGDAEEELTPQAEAVIKTWTGKDGLDYEKKFAVGFTALPTAKLMISANSFPTFTDKSMGTWRRLKIAPFRRANMEYMEAGLDETLRGELSGVLNWALEGLRDLEREGKLVVPTLSRVMWEEFREGANPAGVFLGENYVYEAGSIGGVSTQAVYATYRKWCKINGYQPMSIRTFGREVIRVYPQVVKRRLGTTSRTYMYAGLKLHPQAEVRGKEYQ